MKELMIKLEKAINKLDDCIGDCSKNTADAVSEVYSCIDEIMKGKK